MNTIDGELEMSHFGSTGSRDGPSVEVYIYRFADTADNWTLKVVDRAGHTTVWDRRFLNDLEAYDTFEQDIASAVIRTFLEDGPDAH